MPRRQAVAALVPVVAHDSESVALRDSRQFLAILERSQASYERRGGYGTDEVRRLLGVPCKAPVSARTARKA